MCGIGGVIRFGKEPITEEMISLLLTGNEHRGADACGIAIAMKNGDLHTFKKAVIAWQFVTDDDYAKFIEKNLTEDTWGVIVHTRDATQGTPKDNKNNHPMFAGKSAVIHNGMINNDNTLFKEMKFERKAETDSDILRAFVDEYGITPKGIKEMNKIGGSAAGAAFDPRYPRKMLLFRSGSPMTLGSTNDFFMFASEKGTVYKALKPYVKRFGMWFQVERADAALSPMANDTAWIIGDKGHEFHAEFKTLLTQYHEPFRNTYKKYKNQQKKWEQKTVPVLPPKQAQEVEDAECPKCHTFWVIPKGQPHSKFTCNKDEGGCNANLVPVMTKASGKGVN